jgi:transglutaminase-like putative cysteine protease
MAHPTPTAARIQRLTALAATLLVAAAIGFAFGRVFQGRWPTVLLLGAGTASALLATAFERRSVALAAGVCGSLLVVGLGATLFAETTWHGLPTLATLQAMGHAASLVGQEAREQVSPAVPVDPLLFATAIAVWASVFSCHALAFRAGSPILALLPPMALVAFADSVLEESTQPIYGIWFLIGGLALLFADSLRRVHGWGPVWSGPGRRDRLLPTAGRQARRLAAGAVALAVTAPFVVPGFGGDALIDVTAVRDGGQTRVSTLVSMASTLNGGSSAALFSVSTPVKTYFRLTALERFDGVHWVTSAREEIPIGADTPLASGTPGATEYTQTFTVLRGFSALDDAGLSYLPAGYVPLRASLGREATWDARTQTIAVRDTLGEGDTYIVRSMYVSPSADDLRRAGVSYADGTDLVALPSGFPPAIMQLAQRWVAGAPTLFDEVIAIQDHLTGPEFRYDKTVAYREDTATILDFLKSTRRGFCQQFATAMAVMLRSLGIPARVAVGFTTGRLQTNGSYIVSTSNLHAWVEVPFDGYGYLAFEPTPGRTNAAASSYLNDDEPSGCASGRACPTPPRGGQVSGPTPNIKPRPTETGRGGSTASPQARASVRWIAIGTVAVLLVSLAGVPMRAAWRRRRRLRRAAREPRRLVLAAYDVFEERARQAGLPRAIAETPEEYRRRLLGTGRLKEGDIDRLLRLTVRAAYAPDAPTPEEASAAVSDASLAAKLLRRDAPLHSRVAAAYGRRSLPSGAGRGAGRRLT